MGLFWESKREKELKEEKALEAILKAFEGNSNLQAKENQTVNSNNSSLNSIERNLNINTRKNIELNDLIEFLCRQKIISRNDWEKYKEEIQKK